MQVSCNYRLFPAMRPDLVGFQIRSNFVSHIFFGHVRCNIVKLLVSYASCVSVKRVPLTVFVRVFILSEVRKIDAPKYVLACFSSLSLREEL